MYFSEHFFVSVIEAEKEKGAVLKEEGGKAADALNNGESVVEHGLRQGEEFNFMSIFKYLHF